MEKLHQTMQESGSVLITGGSGLIGRHLTSLLLENGYSVSHLSRKEGHPGRVKVFRWAPEKGVLDPVVLTGTDYIIHLAGANIGEKRWTRERKKEIIASRIESARLIFRVITENSLPLKAFISASAIGLYGAVTSDRIYSENDLPANDFLGTTCRFWEESADLFMKSGIRTVKIRSGVVLEKNDSALSKFIAASRFGVFPVLGSGKQYLPWIHIKDLCNIYLLSIQNDKMQGAWNAVAPDHTDYKRFARTLASVMNRPFFSPPIPSVFMKLAMGESSVVALEGSRVSPEKIISQGFAFEFPTLDGALANVLKS